jgi:cytochrome c553
VTVPVTKFLFGFLTGMLLLLLSAAATVQFGLMDVSANAQIPSWFEQWYSASVRRSVERQASSVTPLAPATDAEVIGGGRLYLNDCVGCHGEPGKPPSEFGATFYPRVPQMTAKGTDYTENQIFWIAKHGIRRTGMSAQSDGYSDQQLLLLTAFISRIRTMPPETMRAIVAPAKTAQQSAEPKK